MAQTSDNDAGGRKGIIYILSNGVKELWVLQVNGSSWISGLGPQVIGTPKLNKWSHVAVTRMVTDSKTRYFVDGNAYRNYTSNVNLMNSTITLTIGSIDTELFRLGWKYSRSSYL